jgi:DNA-binding response OmpR family regulator
VLTKEELLRDVWGFRSLGTTRTLDSHACRLRQKLGADGDRFVVNVWGVGYRLVDGPVLREETRSPRFEVIAQDSV